MREMTNTNTSLSDAIYALSVAKAVPDAELLDRFVQRYPEHAEALTDFAIGLAIDALHHDVDDDATIDIDAVNPVVPRVMSQFENRLFELAHKKAEQRDLAAPALTPVKNPFAALNRAQFRELAEGLRINIVLLTKLRDRQLESDTIPDRFTQDIAKQMNEEPVVIAAHFRSLPAASPMQQHFKADRKPEITAQQSFKEAVRTSGLTEEQQRRLLLFQD